MNARNRFLRRRDVEALLDAKIAACDERIQGAAQKLHYALTQTPTPTTGTVIAKFGREIATEGDRKGALIVTRKHLDMLDQFTMAQPPALSMPVLTDRNGGYVDVEA